MTDNNSAQIGMLITSNQELKVAVTGVSDGLTSLLAFQARAEERHENSNAKIEKLEVRVDTLWDMVNKNSLIVKAGLIVLSLLSGGLISWFFRGL